VFDTCYFLVSIHTFEEVLRLIQKFGSPVESFRPVRS
jgi:hypothetical protein